ncbi:MAG: DUF1501 domain-containing protein [Planctomycetales bacterium]|nr:DUF1501 domain-containing protein [Planctomycetales bacterium]
MLTLQANRSTCDCECVSRRELLRVGSLGLGAITLPALLQASSQGSSAASFVRGKSVVFLYLRGGPTQYETWDPKMNAPSGIRAMYGETKTSLPGVTFGKHFLQMAAMADQLAVVRSFRVGSGGHGPGRQLITSGGNPAKAAMGALYAGLAGSNHPLSGLPTNAVVTPRAAGPQYESLRNETDEILAVGELAAECAAFDLGAGAGASKAGKKPRGGLIHDMRLNLASDRFDDRRALLQQISALRRQADRPGALAGYDRFQQQAFDVLLGGATDAFDLSKEDPRVVAEYDTGRFAAPASLRKKKSNNAKTIPSLSPIALGKQLLLARRLCEAGCGFVTVTSSGWDMHGNAFGIDDGMACLGPAVDHAVAAFLRDLARRGLSEQILLVITGEMGRTPKINAKAGRDHWANLCPLVLAGGGLKMGQVIGASDKTGGSPNTEPYGVDHLLATIMHTLFDVSQLRLARGLPTNLVRTIERSQPIKELVA